MKRAGRLLTAFSNGASMRAMSSTETKSSGGAGTWKLAVWLAVYLAVFGAFAFAASRHCSGRGLMATLTFVECAMLAVVVALFAVNVDPRERGVSRFVVRLLAVCGLAVVASVVVLVVASLAWGAEPVAGGLIAQLVILSFCVLLGAVFAVVRCGGSELFLAQLVSIFVACVLLGTVFYADPIVEAQRSPEARSLVIGAVLASNPLTAIS